MTVTMRRCRAAASAVVTSDQVSSSSRVKRVTSTNSAPAFVRLPHGLTRTQPDAFGQLVPVEHLALLVRRRRQKEVRIETLRRPRRCDPVTEMDELIDGEMQLLAMDHLRKSRVASGAGQPRSASTSLSVSSPPTTCPHRSAGQEQASLLEGFADRRDPERAWRRQAGIRSELRPALGMILGVDLAAGKHERPAKAMPAPRLRSIMKTSNPRARHG